MARLHAWTLERLDPAYRGRHAGARAPRPDAVPPRLLAGTGHEAIGRADRVGIRSAVEARLPQASRRAVRSGDRQDRRRHVRAPTWRLVIRASLLAFAAVA